MVIHILSANYKSFKKILPILLPTKTTVLQFYSFTAPTEMIIYPKEATLYFADSDFISIQTNAVPIIFAVPAINFVMKPFGKDAIFSMPDITFYGEEESSITLLNEWEQIEDWSQLRKKCNIHADGAFYFGYETNYQMIRDAFNVESKDYKEITGVMGGVYNIVETKYANDFTDIGIAFYVDPSFILKRNFVPVNDRLELKFYGFYNIQNSLKIEEMCYKGVDIVISGITKTSFVKTGINEVKNLEVKNAHFEVDRNIDISKLTVQKDSEMIIKGESKTSIIDAEIFGIFSQFSGEIDIKNKIIIKESNIDTLIQHIIKNNYTCITVVCSDAPDILQWKENTFIATFEQNIHSFSYNAFKELSFIIEDAIDGFQVRFTSSLFAKETQIDNKFRLVQRNNASLNLFFDKSWESNKAKFMFEISTKTPSKIFAEGNTSINTDLFDIVPPPSSTTQTFGGYCILKSGKDFSHCKKFDERILYSMTWKNFYIPSESKNKVISIRTNCLYKFDSNNFPNNSQIKIYGKGNDIGFFFAQNQLKSVEFNNVSVLVSSKKTVSLQSLVFQLTDTVNVDVEKFQINFFLKGRMSVLKKILPLTVPSSTLIVEDIFDGDEKSITLTKNDITVNSTKTSLTFNIYDLNHVHFYIDALVTTFDSPLDLFIDVANNSLISQVFDVYSSSKAKNYVRFPKYFGYENFCCVREKGQFSKNADWVFIASRSFLPYSVFDFPANSVTAGEKKNVYCIYKNDASNCPINAINVEYKGKPITKKDLVTSECMDIYLSGSTESKPFTFDISIFKQRTTFMRTSDSTQYIILPKQQINELILNGISASFVKKEANVYFLSLTNSFIDVQSINAETIFGKVNCISPLLNSIINKANIQVIADDYFSVAFEDDSIKIGKTQFKETFCRSLDVIYYKPFIETYPLNLVYLGSKGKQFSLLPTFFFNYESNVNVYFTESWEEITNKKDQKVFINSSRFSEVHVSSEYSTYPSTFSFNKFSFSPKNITNFCLVASKDSDCPLSYKKVVYEKDVKIDQSLIRPTEGKSPSYLIMESNEDNFPILDFNGFEDFNISIASGNENNQFLSVSMKELQSLTLINVNAIIESEKEPLFQTLKLEQKANLKLKKSKKIHAKELILTQNAVNIISKLDKKSKCNVTLTHFDKLTKIEINETHISLDQISFEFSLISDILISGITKNVFIDYRGKSLNNEFDFIPSLSFDENTEECSVTFSSNWQKEELKTKKKGLIKHNRHNSFTVNSDYYGFPESLFDFSEEINFKGKKKGSYCAYKSIKDVHKCDEMLTLLYINKQEHILTLDEIEADDYNEVHIYSTFDLKLSSQLLNTHLFVYPASKEAPISYEIICNKQQTNIGSFEAVNCRTVFSGNEDVKLSSFKALDADFKGKSKFFIEKSIQSSLSVVKKLQPFLVERVQKSHINCSPSSVKIAKDSTVIDDCTLYDNKVGNLVLYISNTKFVSIVCKDNTINNVCSMLFNGTTKVFFDESVYRSKSKTFGNIIIVGGTVTLKSNIPTPPNMFLIPEEQEMCIYEFGPKRTLFPTPTQRRPLHPSRTSNPTKGRKEILKVELKSIYISGIVIISVIIIILISYLVYQYNKFDEDTLLSSYISSDSVYGTDISFDF